MRGSHSIAAWLAAAGLLTAAWSGAAAAAEPTTVRASVGLPPTHPVVSHGWQAFVESAEREAGGSLEFKLFVDGAVVGPSRPLQGLGQGAADMGFLAPADNPEAFPYAALLTELALVGQRGVPAAAALTELVLLHCGLCREEYLRHDLVFLGTYSAAPYVLIGTVPMTGVDSLAMRRVRTPGSLWDRWVEAMGGVPAGQELTPGAALASHAADAVIDVPAALQQPEIAMAATTVTTLPLGAYRGASPFTANRSFWKSLSAVQRRALLHAAAAGSVAATEAYDARARAALAAASEQAIGVTAAEPGLVEAVQRFAGVDADQTAAAAKANPALRDGAAMLATYRELYGKYDTLLTTAVQSSDAVAALRREIYDRLDPASFGVTQDLELRGGVAQDGLKP